MLDIYAWRSASIGHIPPHCTLPLRNPCASKQRPLGRRIIRQPPMADPFAADYTPRTIWRLQRGEHVMEARGLPTKHLLPKYPDACVPFKTAHIIDARCSRLAAIFPNGGCRCPTTARMATQSPSRRRS